MGLQWIGQNGEGVLKHSTATCYLAQNHLAYAVGVTGVSGALLVVIIK